jgi:hypothetical protein
MTQRYDNSVEARMDVAIERGLVRAIEQQQERDLLLACRRIASDTTMIASSSEAWLRGEWDDRLPDVIRRIANHSLKTIEVRNREEGIGE